MRVNKPDSYQPLRNICRNFYMFLIWRATEKENISNMKFSVTLDRSYMLYSTIKNKSCIPHILKLFICGTLENSKKLPQVKSEKYIITVLPWNKTRFIQSMYV